MKEKPRIAINRVMVPKPQDVLADQLRGIILRGEIAEGDSLPSERELVSQTGLPRGAVRDALRTLAVEGLIQTRNGRYGGSVVMLPGKESVATTISHFVQGRKISLRTLQETRDVLEPLLARLAAERRTDDNLLELKALHGDLLASVDNFHEFARINVKWHNAVARASGNELLAAVLFSISDGIYVATMAEEYDTKDTRQQVMRIHSKINDAIDSRNADLAEQAMRQHMAATHARATAPGDTDILLATDMASEFRPVA